MMQLFYIRNEETLAPHRLRQLLALLPPPLQQKISRYRRWQDAQASLFGFWLLIEGLRPLGLPPTTLAHLAYSKQKRPSLPLRPELDFNISHSGQRVVGVLSTAHRVGIDVELVRPIDLQDFKRQWTAAEWAQLNAATGYRTFYNFWTRKEAIIKADGIGLSAPLRDIEVLRSPSRLHGKDWHWQELPLGQQYVVHLVTDHFLPAEQLPPLIDKTAIAYS
ncbi:MAG: 4'-phosphopantetheinyl transferase superfamily protein [Bacteroidota bacterium]